jgi:tetratricopeptide (TPR) repeat protein
MKTCFVITGYGIKKDYINNRDIDLDKTFKHIVKPVFEELGYECKRSCDYPPGIIDTIMYKGIYDADFVIADISTLNPNALYELGVRHALKPYTTLVICEDGIFVNSKLPFDLSHLTALAYHHDGKSLDIDEVDRFKKILKEAVTGMVKANKVDSPVFTHILGLEITVKQSESGLAHKKIPQKNALVKPADAVTATANSNSSTAGLSLSDMIDSAVAAMKNKKFEEAIDALKKLLKLKPDDTFFIQQLCLATYKLEKPNAEDANKNAYKILEQLNPMSSTDTETLGMAGAIHKNLHKITGDKTWLEKSLRFYERGYYIANDYYNGINTAFLYWKLASLADNKEETQFYKMQAKQIAKHVAEICINLMAQEDYNKRNDKEWVTNTLAEAYYGLDDKVDFEKIIASRKKEQNDFSEASFMQQFEELKGIKEKVEALLH